MSRTISPHTLGNRWPLALGAALVLLLGLTGVARANVTSDFDPASGTFSARSDADDAIVVRCTSGGVRLNEAVPPSGEVACGGVNRISVQGGPGDNEISLKLVTSDPTGNPSQQFPALTGVDVSGGGGVDEITGSQVGDVITPDTGNDAVLGQDGDDTIIWNNGDGSDVVDGEAGDDRAVVNGSNAAGDVFTVNPNGQRVRFDRTNLVPFSLDIGTTETLEMNGGGGDDTITGSTGLAPLIKLRMNGGDGNDTLIGSDGDDTMDAGAGDDTMVCGAGHDVMAGNDGDDRMVWNNGDGSDVMDGQAGNDTAEVNGSPTAGDDFSVKPNGNRVRFDRLNLVPFNLDIGTTETLEVHALGGDDRIAAAPGLPGLTSGKLYGEDGNDRIKGTDGADLLSGGPGDDLIRARDGAADQVECNGGVDFARVDRHDLVRGCELVLGGRLRVRPAGGPVGVARGVAALPLRCIATRYCAGTLVMRHAGRKLGAAPFGIASDRAKTVRVKLNRRGRRAAAGTKRLRIQLYIDAHDAAGNGWRTTAHVALKGGRS